MKAYNETWIYNREIVRQADSWCRRNLLTNEQMEAIRRTYPIGFQQTNGYIEIGLFLFTTVTLLGTYLLVSTFFPSLVNTQASSSVFNLIFGALVAGLGWILIQQRQLYHNGIDNAFVVMQTGFLVFGINQLFPPGLSVATHCLISLPLLLLVLWYYGDTLITFFTVATTYVMVFDWLLDIDGGRAALPFVTMGLSAALYVLARQANRLSGQTPYYADCISLTQWCALIGLAASSNYFVAREINRLLLKPIPTDAPELSLAFLFWIFTFCIPGAYLQIGLARKNRMLIILGGLGLVGAVMTLHHYLQWVSLNVALIFGGLLLIGLSIAMIQYLRQPRNGFTDVADDDSPDEFFLSPEALAAAQTVTGVPHNHNDDIKFGGGNFGGGGGSGNY
ncbi:hypothetical protein [Spirosoma sp. KUDC1026]|uniref:hypothetical protein n=1 Tax=Spirosoma sp. KUDC1026 TaxID=2745947 RepID=UPI00159BB0D6|nr:hypothetical protein [Spirosoma sp. KUDC1026]QKZ12492.1 hypothetical protein HU175_07555 [Spirosoma sp. KUDC1026]